MQRQHDISEEAGKLFSSALAVVFAVTANISLGMQNQPLCQGILC